ncbi:transporter suffix domain-containing protein [Chryseobacterium tructae]|jgi:low affinity Fe/Cu permease|uniref:Transporter suffix domain-containing protein n=1 Tax=Chryseobacterium tructae TaxID=1037380 RepID=A0ABV7XUA1_9FLAO|nr:transporter suffix domain-containing protein [Chryseobacterium tructae]MDN3692260.1 transporter suffix domain-containing protein [Chryseobacterium tructae]
MEKSNFKKTLGFIFFAITIICWIGAPILPFTDIPNKAIVTTTVVIVGEVFFLSAIALLGKEYWGKIKQWFKSLFSKKTNNP